MFILRNWLFAPGAAYSVAICRIFIFISILRTLYYYDGQFINLLTALKASPEILLGQFAGLNTPYDEFIRRYGGAAWVPKGVVKILFPAGPPAAAAIYALTITGYLSTLAAIAGLFTRISIPVAVFTVVTIVSCHASWGPYWSHGSNVVLLSAIAFMFARAGDRISLDALIRRRRGLEPAEPPHQGVYRWPVILAELSVHLFMFAAFYSKFTNGGGVSWALSDNLRNSLAVSWGMYRSHPPWIVDVVMTYIEAFKFIGLAQLFLQSTTIISCFLIQAPWWRFLFGAVFWLLEILGLASLFEFYHYEWIPLAALSVDWDRLIAWGKSKRGIASAALVGQGAQPLSVLWTGNGRRVAFGVWAIFAVTFISYYVASFVFQLGEKHLNYPFSSMAFFSGNRSHPPYNIPKPWFEVRGIVNIFEKSRAEPVGFAAISSGHGELWRASTAQSIDLAIQSLRNSVNPGLEWCLSVNELKRRGQYKTGIENYSLRYLLPHCWKPLNLEDMRRIELHMSYVAVPAYPDAPLPMRDMHYGLRGFWDNGHIAVLGSTRAWDAARGQIHIDIDHAGLDIEKAEVLYRRDVTTQTDLANFPAPEVMPGHWEGNRFWIEKGFHGRFLTYPLIRIHDRKFGELIFIGPDRF